MISKLLMLLQLKNKDATNVSIYNNYNQKVKPIQLYKLLFNINTGKDNIVFFILLFCYFYLYSDTISLLFKLWISSIIYFIYLFWYDYQKLPVRYYINKPDSKLVSSSHNYNYNNSYSNSYGVSHSYKNSHNNSQSVGNNSNSYSVGNNCSNLLKNTTNRNSFTNTDDINVSISSKNSSSADNLSNYHNYSNYSYGNNYRNNNSVIASLDDNIPFIDCEIFINNAKVVDIRNKNSMIYSTTSSFDKSIPVLFHIVVAYGMKR